VMIVDEDVAVATTTDNVVLHAEEEVPLPHQEPMALERNGLVMTTQSAKEKSKVCSKTLPKRSRTILTSYSAQPDSFCWRRHVSFGSNPSLSVLTNFFRSSEQELRNIFDRFGKVQTCIVNKDKRHAFVKMISRADAVTAKEAMEKNRSPDSQLRVRSVIVFFCSITYMLIFNRHDGALDLAHAIAVTTKLASASFPSASLLMRTESGC
jgi:RNA recognition motif-containing protein